MVYYGIKNNLFFKPAKFQSPLGIGFYNIVSGKGKANRKQKIAYYNIQKNILYEEFLIFLKTFFKRIGLAKIFPTQRIISFDLRRA